MHKHSRKAPEQEDPKPIPIYACAIKDTNLVPIV